MPEGRAGGERPRFRASPAGGGSAAVARNEGALPGEGTEAVGGGGYGPKDEGAGRFQGGAALRRRVFFRPVRRGKEPSRGRGPACQGMCRRGHVVVEPSCL